MPAARKKYTFESSEHIIIQSNTGDLWNAQFDDPTENDTNAMIEAFHRTKSIGNVQYHSEKSRRSITFTNDEARITVEYKNRPDGSSEVAMITGEDVYRVTFEPDGSPLRIEQPHDEHAHDETSRNLQPLLKSINELQKPLADHFGVAYAPPGGGGGKTKEECDSDYKSKIKSLAGSGIGIAAGAAGACLAGPLGCLVGLGIAIGGKYYLDGEEEKIQAEHEKCLADVENDEAPPPA